jgi:oxygen-independent coproporphyrinogen-3 oxidase
MFLGLRLREGVDLGALRAQFGDLVARTAEGVAEACAAGLAELEGERLRLTAAGRMASNEVFSRLLVEVAV